MEVLEEEGDPGMLFFFASDQEIDDVLDIPAVANRTVTN